MQLFYFYIEKEKGNLLWQVHYRVLCKVSAATTWTKGMIQAKLTSVQGNQDPVPISLFELPKLNTEV